MARLFDLRIRALSLIVLCGVWLWPSVSAAQAPVITSAPAAVPAGPDYATDILGNPWDFSDAMDVSPFPDELGGWTISATTVRTVGRSAFISSGQFVGRVASGHNLVPLLFRGGVDIITSAHENAGSFDHKAIPTAAYGKLALSMTLSASTAGQLAAFWYGTPYGHPAPSGMGAAFRTPQAGTHIYIVDLATGVWTDARGNPMPPSFLPIGGLAPVPWTSTPLMRGLQIRPTTGGTTVDVAIDWVRITQRDGAVGAVSTPITFSGCPGRDYNVEVMTAGGAWDVLHIGTAAATTTTTAFVNHGVLAPGAWNFRVSCFPISRAPGGGTPVSSAPITVTINAPPIAQVINPDAVGGADYATTVRGNPWDMNSLADIAQSLNIANPAIVHDGVSNAFQATAANGDPQVVMNYGPTIETGRFRNLTFSLTLDTPFSLAPPGGSVARVLFERPGAMSMSQDIMVWPGRNVYTIDLGTLAVPTGLEPECGCQNAPWLAGPVRYLRIDPHEASSGVTFRLGPVLLTAFDEVPLGGTFDVQYAFSDADTAGSSYAARVYIDNDRDPGTKLLMDTITAGVAPNATLTYRFNPASRGVPIGDYFLYVEIVESRGGVVQTRGFYSSGPLRVGAGSTGPIAPGAPSLVPVQTGTNPVTIAWSAGQGGAPTSYTVVAGTSPNTANLGAFNVGLQTSISGNVPPGVPIYVRVVATNAVGSAVSNEISFVVSAGLTLPGRPTMGTPVVSGRTVSLSWAAGAGGPPAGFVLLVRVPGNPTPIVAFPTAQTGGVFSGVPPGTFIVSVVAVNAAGPSAESQPATVTVR